MTRIVAGAAKGRQIKVPASGTRPTSERVREALFSRLDHRGYVKDCSFLDLYAGSGAIGLEAASRGAKFVECVESSSKAARIIEANARGLKLAAILVKLTNVLVDDGVVVVERSSRSPEPVWPEGITLTDERAFGDTRIFSASPARLDV